MTKLSLMKLSWRNPTPQIQVPFILFQVYPKYDKKVCYYQEFWKVYLLNEIMITKIKDYSIQNKQLSKDVQEL